MAGPMEIKITSEEMVKMLGWNAQQIITYLQKKFNSKDNLLSSNENNTIIVRNANCFGANRSSNEIKFNDKNNSFIHNEHNAYEKEFELLLFLANKWNWLYSDSEGNQGPLSSEKLVEWWKETIKAYPGINYLLELQMIDAWHNKQTKYRTGKCWDAGWAWGWFGGIRNWFKLISAYRNPYRTKFLNILKNYQSKDLPKIDILPAVANHRLIAIDEIKYQRLIQQAPEGVKKLHRIYQQLDYSFIKIANLDIPKVDLKDEDIQFLNEHADSFAGIAIMLDRFKASA